MIKSHNDTDIKKYVQLDEVLEVLL